jgi:7-keto-8-aminopelargonate synthetase-like enzyme
MSIIVRRQWELKAGDKLDWSLEARGKNQMVIVVRKSNTHNKKKLTNFTLNNYLLISADPSLVVGFLVFSTS